MSLTLTSQHGARLASALIAAFLVMSCSGQSGTESERAACQDVSSATIGADQVTPFGTASELASDSASEYEGRLTWYVHGAPSHDTMVRPETGQVPDDSPHDTMFTLKIVADPASARLIHGRYTNETSHAEATDVDATAHACDALTLNATLQLRSDDGAFDEHVPGTLRKDQGSGPHFSGSLPAAALVGSYDGAANVLAQYEQPHYTFNVLLDYGMGNVFLDGTPTHADKHATSSSAAVAEWTTTQP